jgi:hypothetical protein
VVELIKYVRKYGSGRRHIEISKEYFEDLPVGVKVVVIDKESYDALKKRLNQNETFK